MRRLLTICALLAAALVVGTHSLSAQGVTTSQVRGTVSDSTGRAIAGAQVTAIHLPSNTTYRSTTRADGSFTIPGMRVGGPYQVRANAIGYQQATQDNVFLTLGTATDVAFRLRNAAVELGELQVSAQAGQFSSTRTGAATTVSSEVLAALPTVGRRIADFTRLTPQARGTSFLGMDNRLNNITVDGSYFNNSFGLAGTPGDRTGVAPLPLDAIEQIQVEMAPYDVRQGQFVGAGVNTVTKSGGNDFKGSLYYNFRNDAFVGKKISGNDFDPGTFKYHQIGARLSGPIIPDKLFFFANYEDDNFTEPGTLWTANAGGEPIEGTKTRVLKSDLDNLSSFLEQKYGYATGPYQGYDNETPSKRFLGRIDWNVSDRNKFSLRYTHLDSKTDVLASNSSSLGTTGNRRTNPNSLTYQNTNYQILENIRSIVGELNSQIGDNMSNQLIAGYNYSDESRDTRGGAFFPLVDIQENGANYISFGYEPFTPSNQLRYHSWQLQDNFTIYGNKLDWTFGVTGEKYHSDNVFFPGSQSVYVYNSLDDFYADARDGQSVTLRRFQVRYSNIPGQVEPLQPLDVTYLGAYAQAQWRAMPNVELTLGFRADVPSFGQTGYTNPEANAFTFRDQNGQDVRYQTQKLPDANLLYSPRLGFNWDVKGEKRTQVRGGTGVFTGRPAYVWISNQIGNNGLLTGFEQIDNTTTRPFNPDPDAYKPAPTGQPAASYELALTDPNFKFPQVWRSNIAVDQKLPKGFVGTAEFLYSKDVNGISYINANLPANQTTFTGVDNRQRWTDNRIHDNIPNAVVLGNEAKGTMWNIALSLEKAFSNGFFAKVGYNYGESKNTVDPGSIASGSYFNNPIVNDPNNPTAGLSANTPGKRYFAAVSWKRDFTGLGNTGISAYFSGETQGFGSYRFSGDANGDGGSNNDLIYIPKDASEMNFQQYTSGGKTFTVADQAAAWEAYIQQDDYLSSHRGQYAERNAVAMPILWRGDLSITQDLAAMVGGRANILQVRVDLLNFTHLLNSDWGVSYRFNSEQPLTSPSAANDGSLQYRLRNFSGNLISPQTFIKNAGINDTYRFQMSLRYMFN